MTAGSLEAHNTLRLPATAASLVTIRRESTLYELVAARRTPPPDADQPAGRRTLTVLGGGSNVVLLERVDGVVCLMRTRGFRQDVAAPGAVEVTAAAGERWHDLVRYSLGQGLCGLENLALIPGSVGAAPIQNIGAYGCELAEHFVRLRALDTRSGRVRTMDGEACRFGYRDSLFKSMAGAHLVVLDVTLRLHRRHTPVTGYPDLARELARIGSPRPTAVQVAEAVVRVRRRKLPDPRRVGNAGSFFKNPLVPEHLAAALARTLPALSVRPAGAGQVKLSAAQLIDACGWKGRRLGDVEVWARQPLVLCNVGRATGRDVLAMGENIRHDVRQRFGVDLEREPQIIGQD